MQHWSGDLGVLQKRIQWFFLELLFFFQISEMLQLIKLVSPDVNDFSFVRWVLVLDVCKKQQYVMIGATIAEVTFRKGWTFLISRSLEAAFLYFISKLLFKLMLGQQHFQDTCIGWCDWLFCCIVWEEFPVVTGIYFFQRAWIQFWLFWDSLIVCFHKSILWDRFQILIQWYWY